MPKFQFKVYTDDSVYPRTFDIPTRDEELARTNLAVFADICREGRFNLKIVRVALYDFEDNTTLETLTI